MLRGGSIGVYVCVCVFVGGWVGEFVCMCACVHVCMCACVHVCMCVVMYWVVLYIVPNLLLLSFNSLDSVQCNMQPYLCWLVLQF